MIHTPIVKGENIDGCLNFSHFNTDAPAGAWRRERAIVCDYIKINIFKEGHFSVFEGDKLHRAVLGDLMVIPPGKLHYGHIPKPTHLDYYQLDVGMQVFNAVPGAEETISRLLRATEEHGTFIRPSPKLREEPLELCRKIEKKIKSREPHLAYAATLELISLLARLYSTSKEITIGSFSYHTERAIKRIEEGFSEELTVHMIAADLGVSASYVSRIFKKETGMGIHEYLMRYRVLKAAAMLSECSVAEAAYSCGFSDSSHFILLFKKYMNTTPKKFKMNLLNQSKNFEAED